ncbi:hypothetical protein B0H19DRAFT_1122698 [Mycena capillaripes]|nr:hypothetical protein B0H19DRAFT_1122698 [Mycena capillaripes]
MERSDHPRNELLFLPLPPLSPASSAVLSMVLTRRAHKCIVTWFPNEVISEVFLYMSPMDLLALCRTSRLINGLATPLLYRCIDLRDIFQMETFVSALEKYAESPMPLWCHIQKISITMHDGSTLEHSLSSRITTALSKCLDLHTLGLITPHAHLSALFVDAHFPNLRAFHHIVMPDAPTDLSAFLNRHQTITSLALMLDGDGNFHLDPLKLHNLTTFSGDSFSLPWLICDKTLDVITIFFINHDFEAALERLRPMTCSEEVELVIRADDIDMPYVFARIAASMPQITSLAFRELGPFSPGAPRLGIINAINIQMQLQNLKYLRVLELDNFKEEEPHDMMEIFEVVDQLAVEKWGETCPSLTSIVFHGQHWERVGTEWEAIPYEA